MKMTTKEFLENANAEMGRKVWKHYGEEAQTKKLVEELAELITAIARKDTRAIREEMADVEVMIMQFKQGSQMKHITMAHLIIRESCRMALKQLKRIYHFKEVKENDT